VKRTTNLDTFVLPLVEDLRLLATTGVAARRWVDGKLMAFQRRAHLILANGDMPACAKVRSPNLLQFRIDLICVVSKIMHFKGHNGKSSCRWCRVEGIPFIVEAPEEPPDDGAPPNEATRDNSLEPETHAANRAPPASPSNLAGADAPEDDDAPPTASKKKKKKKQTTYHVARLPSDLPVNLQNRGIVDLDYEDLPQRTDENVKADINHQLESEITKAERERRRTKAGISSAVSTAWEKRC
jgi:hypothetical protein